MMQHSFSVLIKRNYSPCSVCVPPQQQPYLLEESNSLNIDLNVAKHLPTKLLLLFHTTIMVTVGGREPKCHVTAKRRHITTLLLTKQKKMSERCNCCVLKWKGQLRQKCENLLNKKKCVSRVLIMYRLDPVSNLYQLCGNMIKLRPDESISSIINPND